MKLTLPNIVEALPHLTRSELLALTKAIKKQNLDNRVALANNFKDQLPGWTVKIKALTNSTAVNATSGALAIHGSLTNTTVNPTFTIRMSECDVAKVKNATEALAYIDNFDAMMDDISNYLASFGFTPYTRSKNQPFLIVEKAGLCLLINRHCGSWFLQLFNKTVSGGKLHPIFGSNTGGRAGGPILAQWRVDQDTFTLYPREYQKCSLVKITKCNLKSFVYEHTDFGLSAFLKATDGGSSDLSKVLEAVSDVASPGAKPWFCIDFYGCHMVTDTEQVLLRLPHGAVGQQRDFILDFSLPMTPELTKTIQKIVRDLEKP